MTKETGILVFGVIVAVMPFLGFPNGVEEFIIVVSGISIVVLAVLIQNSERKRGIGKNGRQTEMFVENGESHITEGIVTGDTINNDQETNTETSR